MYGVAVNRKHVLDGVGIGEIVPYYTIILCGYGVTTEACFSLSTPQEQMPVACREFEISYILLYSRRCQFIVVLIDLYEQLIRSELYDRLLCDV